MWKPATLARMYCWTARVIVFGPASMLVKIKVVSDVETHHHSLCPYLQSMVCHEDQDLRSYRREHACR